MIFSPAVLALLLGSALVTGMMAYAAYFGRRIIQSWDIRSGSELQLDLERRSSLISTIVSYGLAFQFVSLFLFVYTADRIAPMFVGAMCAAGSLNVNHWGYWSLTLKVANLALAGVWLALNHTDSRAPDYPLIQPKYALLMAALPFAALETYAQARYFFSLSPDVITSCCGSLFSSEAAGTIGMMVGLPRTAVTIAFGASMAATLACAAYVWRKARGAQALAILSAVSFVTSALALISVVSIYIYELPTHHCPFCILQKEYGYIGYPMYLTLLTGTVTGVGAGVVGLFREVRSLREVVPTIQRQLAAIAFFAFAAFVAIAVSSIATSNLKM